MTVPVATPARATPIPIDGPIARNRITSVADLMPPDTKALWDNDVCLLVGPSARYSNGCIVSAAIGEPIIVRVKNGTRAGLVFSDAFYDRYNHDSERMAVVPGLFAVRQYSTPDERALATWTEFQPVVNDCGMTVIDITGSDVYVEFVQKHVTWIRGATTAAESMYLKTEGGVENGLVTAISGVVTNEDATLEPVEWPQMPFEYGEFSDSNAQARTVAENGEPEITMTEPAYVLVNIGSTVATGTWARTGVLAQWPYLVSNALADRIGRRPALFRNSFGGRWQGGEMAEDFLDVYRAYWPHPFPNPSEGWDRPGTLATSVLDAANRITLGQYKPKIFGLYSFVNDALRAAKAYALNQITPGSVTDTFSGSAIKDSVGKKAGSVGLMQQIVDALPSTMILAILGPMTDADVASTWPSTTFTKIWEAITGTDSAYYRCGSGQADANKGLALRLSDYIGSTGIPNDLSVLHFTATQHAAIYNAIFSIIESWVHTQLGFVFVDSVNGNDSNAGTIAAPKKTLSGAGTSWSSLFMKCGSIFAELATFATSGTSGAPKFIGAYGTGDPPIIYGGLGARNCATITGRSYLTFNRIHFAGGIVGVSLATSATGISFYDCAMYSNTSHGVSIGVTGSTNLFERCAIYSNGADGINSASSVSFTTRRCDIHDNAVEGVSNNGTATWIDERSVIRKNGQDQVLMTGGTISLRCSQLVMADNPSIPSVSPAVFAACVRANAGTATLYNVLFDNRTVGNPSYCLSMTGTSRFTEKNCIWTGSNSETAPFLRIEAFGASGNCDAMSNCAADDFDGAGVTTLKYVIWANGAGVETAVALDFAGLQARTDRSGNQINANGVEGHIGLGADPATDPFGAVPDETSVCIGAGTNLSGTFGFDWRNRKRPTSGSWDIGPWRL